MMNMSWSKMRNVQAAVPVQLLLIFLFTSVTPVTLLADRLLGQGNKVGLSELLIASVLASVATAIWITFSAGLAFAVPSLIMPHRSQEEFLEKLQKIDTSEDWETAKADKMIVWQTADLKVNAAKRCLLLLKFSSFFLFVAATCFFLLGAGRLLREIGYF